MPKLKIERIVSFSSEDPIYVANNILLNNPLKIWKCQLGETSANMVLQLEKPTVISEIHIGNEHCAYIEVLVRNTKTSNDFEVLLVMSSFMSPFESRQSFNVQKIRIFTYENFKSLQRNKQWDQVKVFCIQPFNRNVQYGLSFITLYSPDKDSKRKNPKTSFSFLENANATSPLFKIDENNKEPTHSSFEETLNETCSTNLINNVVTGMTVTDKDKKYNTTNTGFQNTAASKGKDIKVNCETNKLTTSNKITKQFNKLLEGVTIVISGIQNPERSVIREEAFQMGAKYKPDWERNCTHLICAFANTPKFNQAKQGGKIVNRQWISDCYAQRKRLPWRRYALENLEKNKAESEDEIWEETRSQEANGIDYRSSDVETSTDAAETTNDLSSDTEEEDIGYINTRLKPFPELPDFMSDIIIYIDDSIGDEMVQLLTQYITSFNGVIADKPSNLINYVISRKENAAYFKSMYTNAPVVSSDWIWDCHNNLKLVSTNNYKL